MSHAECIAAVISRRGSLNPLLEAPWVKTSIFKMDWLHAADQGVSADFVGNVFHYFLGHFPGNNVAEQCTALFQDVLLFYEENHVQDKLDPSFRLFSKVGQA